jgi:two-component system LytT family sensor kinase
VTKQEILEDSFTMRGFIDQSDSVRQETKSVSRQRWRAAALIFGFYTFLTLLFLPQTYFYSRESDRFLDSVLSIGRLAIANYLWAVLSPVVFWLGNRFPIERPKLLRNLSLHFLFFVLLAAFYTIAFHYILGIILGENIATINRALFHNWAVFLTNVTNGFMFYFSILAFNQALNYSRKYRDREFRLQQAELEALKTQLHPHFLFNTLNAIAALVYVSPPDATKTISQLSDLIKRRK